MEWKVTGSMSPREDGGFDVDLTVTGDAAPPAARRTPSPTVAARTPEEIAGEIDALREKLGPAAALADDMADLMASKNKRGKVAQSRLLREVYLPLANAIERGLTLDALVHGLEVALAKGVPNANYAKRAAEGHGQQEPRMAAPSASGTGAYQVIGR